MKRIILDDQTAQKRVNDAVDVTVRYVTVGVLVSETKTTNRIDRVLVCAYVNGVKHRGQVCHWTGKSTGQWPNRRFRAAPLSVSKNRDKALKKIEESFGLESMRSEAFGEAFGQWVASLRDLKAEVRWFCKSSGEGMLRVPSLGYSVQVHACNLIGAKTGFSHTACTYLVEGETVTIKEIHPQCGAVITDPTNVHFDQDHWDSMDQDSLAFKKNDDGTFKNGLFG